MTAPAKQAAVSTATRPAPGYRLSDDGDEKGAIYLESLSDGTVYEWERRVPAWRVRTLESRPLPGQQGPHRIGGAR